MEFSSGSLVTEADLIVEVWREDENYFGITIHVWADENLMVSTANPLGIESGLIPSTFEGKIPAKWLHICWRCE